MTTPEETKETAQLLSTLDSLRKYWWIVASVVAVVWGFFESVVLPLQNIQMQVAQLTKDMNNYGGQIQELRQRLENHLLDHVQ